MAEKKTSEIQQLTANHDGHCVGETFTTDEAKALSLPAEKLRPLPVTDRAVKEVPARN